MQSPNKPKRRIQQYHFGLGVTPKSFPKHFFQNAGTDCLYKLQVLRGNRIQDYNVLKRNIPLQALDGYYKSQHSFVSIHDYVSTNSLHLTIRFSYRMQQKSEQKIIFQHRLLTYSIVKDYTQNNVNRTTQLISNNLQTQFYLDIYIQKDKTKLMDKVKSDANKHLLNRKHFDSSKEIQKIVETMVTFQMNSPSRAGSRRLSRINSGQSLGQNLVKKATRSTTPSINLRKSNVSNSFFQDTMSEHGEMRSFGRLKDNTQKQQVQNEKSINRRKSLERRKFTQNLTEKVKQTSVSQLLQKLQKGQQMQKELQRQQKQQKQQKQSKQNKYGKQQKQSQQLKYGEQLKYGQQQKQQQFLIDCSIFKGKLLSFILIFLLMALYFHFQAYDSNYILSNRIKVKSQQMKNKNGKTNRYQQTRNRNKQSKTKTKSKKATKNNKIL